MRTQEEARAEALKMVPAMLEGVKSALMKDSTPATVDTLQTVLWVLGEAYRLSGVVVPKVVQDWAEASSLTMMGEVLKRTLGTVWIPPEGVSDACILDDELLDSYIRSRDIAESILDAVANILSRECLEPYLTLANHLNEFDTRMSKAIPREVFLGYQGYRIAFNSVYYKKYTKS